jgi:hypothetical protein
VHAAVAVDSADPAPSVLVDLAAAGLAVLLLVVDSMDGGLAVLPLVADSMDEGLVVLLPVVDSMVVGKADHRGQPVRVTSAVLEEVPPALRADSAARAEARPTAPWALVAPAAPVVPALRAWSSA